MDQANRSLPLKWILLYATLISAPDLCAQTSEFCRWSTSEKIFRLEEELIRGAKFPDDEIVRTANLQKLRTQRLKTARSDLPPTLPGRAPSTTTVTAQNIEGLFKHPLEKSMQGAKAIVFQDVDGKMKPIFWNSLERSKAQQLHHRDVVSAVLKRRSQNLIAEAGETAHTGASNFLVEEGTQLITMSNLVGRSQGIRNQSIFPKAVLEEMQGFQMSMDATVKKIVHLDVSSSVTAAQVTRGGLPLNVEKLAEQITAVHNAIDPSLRGYKTIRLENGLYQAIEQQGLMSRLQSLIRSSLSGRSIGIEALPD